jgi:cyclic pyranopterin phosphate synthase
VLRANPAEDGAVKQAIVNAMCLKPHGHDFDLRATPVIFRHMNATGG